MMFRALTLIFLVLILPANGHADALRRATLAGLSGSERLRQFSMGQAILEHRNDPRVAQAMRASLQQNGFYFSGSRPAILSRSAQIDPVLGYDANINGGFLNDQFEIFGLSFDIDPSRRALAGIIGGARAHGQMRLAYGEGRYLDLRGSVEAAYAPQHQIGRAQAGFEACARNHLRGWSFADLCLTGASSWRSLSRSNTASISLSFAQLHAGPESAHEFTAGLSRTRLDTGPQNAVTLGWNAVWNQAVTGIEVTMAEPVAGETAMRHRLQTSVSWDARGRAIRLGAWHQLADGGMLLGIDRVDRVSGVSLSVQARPGLTVEVTHQVTQSTVNMFDERRSGLSLRFDLGRR